MNDGRTVLFFDNLKGTLDSPVLEANMTAKQIGIRMFKIQAKLRRPNDIIWLLTTNDLVPSEDMLSRCLHIRLHFEGLPDEHRFQMTEGELTAYVSENRNAILAELAGMVLAWRDAGQPEEPARCRFAKFGRVVGSVLAYNGLPGLMSNAREEVCANSSRQQQLLALMERLITNRLPGFLWECPGEIEAADDAYKSSALSSLPKVQSDWVPHLIAAGAISTSSDTAHKQKTTATRYLAGVVKKPVEVDVGGCTVRAMIVSRPMGGHRTAYALAVQGLPMLLVSPSLDGGAADRPSECPAAPGGLDAMAPDIAIGDAALTTEAPAGGAAG